MITRQTRGKIFHWDILIKKATDTELSTNTAAPIQSCKNMSHAGNVEGAGGEMGKVVRNKNLKMLIVDNFFFGHLMVTKPCTFIELGNT